MVPSRFEIVQPTDRFVISHQNDGKINSAESGNFAFLLEGKLEKTTFRTHVSFGHGISNPILGVENYLKVHKKRNINQIISYMRRYSSVLETGGATILLSLTGPQRRHAMEALTILSKLIGCYDKWQQIRKSNYSLRWTNGNESVQALERFFNPEMSLDSMLSKVRGMIQVLPDRMGQVIRFACLTGLRPGEACVSVRLLNCLPTSNLSHGTPFKSITSNKYYNPEQQCLEHFRYPNIFLRPTKKAYLSYLSSDNYHYFANLEPKTPSLAAISSSCKRRKIQINMHLCRKIFASYIRHKGIEPEVCDLLQGRVSQSVLTRHYVAPSQDLKDRVLDAVAALQKEIEKYLSKA